MAALETIRTKFGIGATIIIALGLLLFLVPADDMLNFFSSCSRSSDKNNVGSINGVNISYVDFEDKVKENSTVYEILYKTSASGEDFQRQMREMAWNELVSKYLILPAIEKAGITVGKGELSDRFSTFFYDENGEFSVEAAQRFEDEEAADNTGRMKLVHNYLVDGYRADLLSQKYTALFSASAYVNSLESKRAIEENNTVANVDFVMVHNNYYPVDSAVVVSQSDIEKYYKAHKDNFKQEAARVIEYALFDGETPSAADIAAQSEAFAGLYDTFESSDNVRAFLQQHSDRQWDDNWYKDGDLHSGSSELDSWVNENKSGVSPVFQSGESFYAARIMETASVPDSVYVRHILLQGADARHLADSLLPLVKSNSFSALAVEYSADKGNADGGEQGNIGWMSQRAIIPGFEPVLSAKVGQPFLLNTQYGTHIVEVTKTTKALPKKKVAIFEKTTLPSNETTNLAYNKAQQLIARADGKYENYKAACDSLGVYSHTTTITEGTESYSGVINAKSVTRWAFDNKPGKVTKASDKLQGGKSNKVYFVVAVREAKEEGYSPLAEVTESIRTRLYRTNYSQYRKEQVAADMAGLTTLEAIAEKLGTTVSNLTDVSFSTSSAPATEPAFIGAVASAREGEICGPVAGIMGTYVFKVNSRETGSYYTEDDAKQAQGWIENYHSQILWSNMVDKNVKDNRTRFY